MGRHVPLSHRASRRRVPGAIDDTRESLVGEVPAPALYPQRAQVGPSPRPILPSVAGIDSKPPHNGPFGEVFARTGYVVLKATHATFLTLQLPRDVAELIGFDAAESAALRAPGREVAFLARGPGVCRVISLRRSASMLAEEIQFDRFIASARVSRKRLFFLPVAVAHHLGLEVERASPSGKTSTFDSVVWLADAPAYYEYRSGRDRSGRESSDETPPARVYVTKSMIPMPLDLEGQELSTAPETDAPDRHRTPGSVPFAWPDAAPAAAPLLPELESGQPESLNEPGAPAAFRRSPEGRSRPRHSPPPPAPRSR
jgi:hypothetical protein